MSEYMIANETVSLSIKSKGAEISSIRRKGTEYMWQADPAFWGRTAPVLFPVVGAFRNKSFRYAGNAYTMNQHGFARDAEFQLVEQQQNKLGFVFSSDEDTLSLYPFPFQLGIQYELKDNQIHVQWSVTNTGEKEMYFSIGGHPAFRCPICPDEQQKDYRIRIQKQGKLLKEISSTRLIDGLAGREQIHYNLLDGELKATEELFSYDALVLEHKQADQISLVKPTGEVYLTVHFETPLVGIWTPPHKNAPFICIEPWYGRCDRVDFEGTLEEREWGNSLNSGDTFRGGFDIEVGSV